MSARRARPSRPSLGVLVGYRVVFFACLAMALQTVLVFVDYWFDDENLADLMIHRETHALATGLTSGADGRLSFRLPERMLRYADGDGAYFLRVRTEAGATLFSNCGTVCEAHLLPRLTHPPDFWVRTLAPGKPISLTGGQAFTTKTGGRVLVEVAILGDPTGILYRVLLDELIEHMVTPMGVMLIISLGATMWSIRAALRPVREAALRADALDPLAPASRLDTTDMPSEIAHLADAVNRGFSRVGSLMRAQKLFTAAIAHEVRTPLAALRLELERIDDPRARRAEGDVAVLSRFVSRMTALARLEGVDRSVFRTVDPVSVGEEVVETLAPLVLDGGRTIEFVDRGAVPVFGHRPLVLDAIRNLVDNAVTHTPPGTEISVEAGPGRRLAVTDTGPGFPESYHPDPLIGHVKRPGGMGIGLSIVRRIAELHGGTLQISRTECGGASVALLFPEGGPPEGAPT